MYVQKHQVSVVTDENGDGVGYTPVCNGRILSIQYVKATTGGYSDGVDIDVETDDTAATIWSADDVNNSTTVCPRQQVHSTAGVGLVYAPEGESPGEPVTDYIFIANERIKITVDAGGDGKTGLFIVLVG